MTEESQKAELATFGGGCFWCTEAIFQKIRGITRVVSGYAGGARPNPSYEQVSTGATGHVEVVQIEFNPDEISYAELLEIFWSTHDPTTIDRQGADVGSQYRSIIFTHNDEQRQIAQNSRQDLDKSGRYKDPIVTKIEPFDGFYPAEDYHQNYYQTQPTAPYCQLVIEPKLQKLLQKHSSFIKS